MNKQGLNDYITRRSPLIDKALRSIIPPRDAMIPNLHDAIEYALGLDVGDDKKRGKHFRPILCLLASEMLGESVKKAIPFAVAIELMHNYCLVHDDIEDGDTIRRGRTAVWVKFGLAHGINAGDYMLAVIYRYLLACNGKLWDTSLTLSLLNLMARTLEHTLSGQTLDINARNSRSISMREYLHIVTEKTGYYLAAPILGGAMIAGAESAVLRSISKFGSHVGPLFQIIDDIIDLTVGKGRNEIGADIKEGKRSFMVIYTAERCTRKEAKEMFDILDKPRDATSPGDIKKIQDIFSRYDAIPAGHALCKDLYTRSLKALKPIPRDLAESLAAFAEILTERIT